GQAGTHHQARAGGRTARSATAGGHQALAPPARQRGPCARPSLARGEPEGDPRAPVTSRPLLDTHVWLWWLDGSGSLAARERAALDELPPTACPYVAAISLWELATLVERKRVVLRQGFEAWIDVAAAPETVTVVDVTPAVAKELVHFPKGFHHDHADRLIVAPA